MGNVYFGDQVTFPSNWNLVASWYLTTGYSTSKATVPGTPLGRLPNPSTDTVIINSKVTTGPTSPYSGVVNLDASLFVVANYEFEIADGLFSGTINLKGGGYYQYNLGVRISGGTFTGPVNLGAGSILQPNSTISWLFVQPRITGGNFSGTVTTSFGLISGGTFTGTVVVSAPVPNTINMSIPSQTGFAFTNIRGGTYSPSATVNFTRSGGVWVSTGYPHDPGFAAGGGTFSPSITYTGLPDTLGSGLL